MAPNRSGYDYPTPHPLYPSRINSTFYSEKIRRRTERFVGNERTRVVDREVPVPPRAHGRHTVESRDRNEREGKATRSGTLRDKPIHMIEADPLVPYLSQVNVEAVKGFRCGSLMMMGRSSASGQYSHTKTLRVRDHVRES